jgi:7,8-dihydropterin-6-yl-methyl-4-(beta-D-ribofuranosyl)aminobenzene 5'-phosphate synthase
MIEDKKPLQFKIEEADSVEIISIVDNSADFLSSTDKKQVQSFRQWTTARYGQEWTRSHAELPVAEHGFSMLVRVRKDVQVRTVLFDTGVSAGGIVENASRMGLNLKEVEVIVLSHGHYDHFGGLEAAVKKINNPGLPIVAHKSMFEARGTSNSDGTIREYPKFPAEARLSPARIVTTKQPSLLVDGLICVTGEIPRKTSYERGFTRHRTFMNSEWQPDPWIRDDRAIVINVKGKGLVVLSGCAHAGIINTVHYAQQITGVKSVYAVMGGFHLAGKEFEKRIKPSIKELKRINPQLIVPSHCTGWKAMCALAEKLPEAFIWNSVGNLYRL